jgi:hypothetical protein
MEATLVEMDASIRNFYFRIDFRTDLWRRISAVARNTTTQAKQGRQAGPIAEVYLFHFPMFVPMFGTLSKALMSDALRLNI